ncbi:16S rRNA (adenine(1518)-N(6)/adenine(1519)-N(6))-dimethyltransferase RsmA [Candidatus Gracilibacteria bacterium]|nr:16S rRNA (adenine(1518)-N(6)/adenine(1519)-N(6))-dimethyltransferase RsmA [Candidatus Gracilibacteria bacterium]MCF7898640.1 16S rRNA (adenine(1518)-N(6)/adenine(1519)-N(6))-dimethyltransferase RsmA [Candidatus Paceibacterota bacterium]
MKPKKSLGQNFLTSIPARIAIVNAGNLSSSDTVLEIGPGRGFLTVGLLETGARVVALEKDRELLPILTEQFSKYPNFTLIKGDALEFEFKSYQPLATSYKLIANIPYYITGAILSKYLSSEHQPSQMVVLVQQEVAERVVARDNKESILSLAVKVYGEPKIVYRVKRGSFNPIPNVDSAVLSIDNISRKNFKDREHEENFFKVVKGGFSHKRKFLISNLKEKLPEVNWLEIFKKNNINEKIRAEDVPLEMWLNISQL